MKLGVAVNAYDGVELMERAIMSYRDVVDYVCIVYQTVSNFGEVDQTSAAVSRRLLASGVVDAIFEFDPKRKSGFHNELAKRNVGLNACRRAGCTHHLSADVDEFYVASELDIAKSAVLSNGSDASACQMITYYGSGDWAFDPPEEYYVPLIYKIDPGRQFEMCMWQVQVDPTRRMRTQRTMLFDRKTVQMHHMSYVRNDIKKKLNNSSARANFKNRAADIASAYAKWVPGERAYVGRVEDGMVNLIRVENKFNIGKNGL